VECIALILLKEGPTCSFLVSRWQCCFLEVEAVIGQWNQWSNGQNLEHRHDVVVLSSVLQGCESKPSELICIVEILETTDTLEIILVFSRELTHAGQCPFSTAGYIHVYYSHFAKKCTI